MKNLIVLVLCFLFVELSLFATVHTISNDPNNPAQYTDIQAAHDAAIEGDTLYVYGSPNSYEGTYTIKKRII